MAKFLDDILREPSELLKSLGYTLGEGRKALEAAAALVKGAREIFITGIGSSWHAGMAVESVLGMRGRVAHLVDASELLHFTPLTKGAVMIVLSRSGKSVEVVKLLDKAEKNGVAVIGITNTPESPLAQRAKVVLPMKAAFDHNVSVTMYSALTLVGGLLAEQATVGVTAQLEKGLGQMLEQAGKAIGGWRAAIEKSGWFDVKLPTYFLGRAGSLASCHEARLLWEEAAKAPAAAMTTGGFRHGPQEMILGGAAIGLWVDDRFLRREDLSLAKDLRGRGAKLMVIGTELPEDAGDLVLSMPKLPAGCEGWGFLDNIIPAQLASYQIAMLRKADCDNFLICPYIITSEGGL